MRTSTLFGAKNFRFFEICGVSARTRGDLSKCGHFADKGGGVNFSRFCGDSFMDDPLRFGLGLNLM